MPYDWTEDTRAHRTELRLWPHQSLPPRGFVLFMGSSFALLLLPLIPLLGTVLLWGLLPFFALAMGGTWYAIHRSRWKAHVLEILTLTEDRARLVRHNPGGDLQEWDCNRYWAQARMHPKGGPVPNYVTLKGGGREVEIGAFLSEDERRALYDDLLRRLRVMEP